MTITIGTSGYHYEHWMGAFYPEHQPGKPVNRFQHYVDHFDSVELNNTFYRWPAPQNVQQWRRMSPKGFTWSVKANKSITHFKKLKDPQLAVQFVDDLRDLEEHLGVVLFQLPPRFTVNLDRLKALLDVLPPEVQYAFEFRDRSWITHDVMWLLKCHGASFCIYDFNGYMTPDVVTADTVYVRLHGPGKPYADSYSEEFLDRTALQLMQLHQEGYQVFCYFDNDNLAHAPRNAQALRDRITVLEVTTQIATPFTSRPV